MKPRVPNVNWSAPRFLRRVTRGHMDTNTDATAQNNGEAAQDLAAELAAAKAEAKANYDKFLYAMADLDNFKKRVQRDSQSIILHGKKSLLGKFLPVLDNLTRALSFEGEGAGLRGGLEATLKGFEAVLASEGVTPIEVKGKLFDPHTAEAIGTQPAPGVPDDTVLEEAQRGYMLGEELLRPAHVIVAKNDH